MSVNWFCFVDQVEANYATSGLKMGQYQRFENLGNSGSLIAPGRFDFHEENLHDGRTGDPGGNAQTRTRRRKNLAHRLNEEDDKKLPSFTPVDLG